MSEYVACKPDELYHYGVLGMKWGVRRYQNKNGKLTDAGRQRYATNTFKKATKKADKIEAKRSKYFTKGTKKQYKATKKLYDADNGKQFDKSKKQLKKASKVLKKAGKYEKKGRKWSAKMEKYFHDVSINDIDKEVLKNGRKYAYLFVE